MFPERLNYIRKVKGFTAQKMADLLMVGLRTYRNYESGHSSPNIYMLAQIADILDVTTDYLLCRGEEPADEHQTCPPSDPKA